MFTVACEDFGRAEQIALRQVAGGSTISSQEIPDKVTALLAMEPHEIREWVTIQSDPLVPRRSTRGSKKDA
jgi:hypothetical protein